MHAVASAEIKPSLGPALLLYECWKNKALSSNQPEPDNAGVGIECGTSIFSHRLVKNRIR
ncbi:hypothetical protein BCU12_19140 [Vibrio sp. 10N.261.55.A7]|nr:hypothetical protein BCU12_19140 [Vibrio sp. 10N.261.55.A7]